jgi:hypothetical protein
MKATLTLTLLLSSTAFADEAKRETSAELLKYCVEEEKALNGVQPERALQVTYANRCMYYLDGFRDALDVAKGPQVICFPQEASTEHLARVVVKYLRDNPSKLHLDKIIGTHTALREAYPCR